MKKTLVALTLVTPIAFGATIALHGGVAVATPSYVQSAAQQKPGAYTLDPAHTSIGFVARHLGIADVHGRFNTKEGKLQIGQDPTESSVEVTIQANSVDTAVAPRDNHLRSGDFFEVEKYPTITFKSTQIRKQGSMYVMDGNLTMKAVTRKVTIPFRYFGPITDPWGGTRIGAIAEPIRINRKDFGVAYDAKLPDGTEAVSSTITIQLSMEATLDKPQ